MYIQISNLPTGITVGELKDGLLKRVGVIDHIFFLDNAYQKGAVTLIKVKCSRIEINLIASRLNGKFFHNQRLQAYPLLFFV